MSTTESALCIWEKGSLESDAISPAQVIAMRRRQFAMFDLKCIMADLGDRVLFSLEGEEESVAAAIGLLGQTSGGGLAAPLWQATIERPPGGCRFVIANLRPAEANWVAERLAFGSRDMRDILVCLEWAASRSRENELLGLAGLPFGPNDPFPLAVGGMAH
jgi:hypothetical protein